jgi:hypothetical protein
VGRTVTTAQKVQELADQTVRVTSSGDAALRRKCASWTGGKAIAGAWCLEDIMTVEERLARLEHEIEVLKAQIRELFERFHKYIEETSIQD